MNTSSNTENDGMNATVQGTQWLTDLQLQKLAEDEKNRVYRYTYDDGPSDPTGRLTSTVQYTADEIRDLIRNIRDRYLQLKGAHPDYDDDKLRYLICSEKYRWKEFSRSYALNFKCTTDSATDQKKMEHQYYMLYIKKQIEEGVVTSEQSHAIIHEYLLKQQKQKQG